MSAALRILTLALGPFETNTYILACSATRDCAVVDVGFDPEAVVRRLEQERLTPRLILNTHAHYDHVCGTRAFQRAVGGEFWLHPADRPLLERVAQQGSMFGLPPVEPPEDVHDLADGQRIALGNHTLAVIHTPGHSPGSVTFHSGDTLWVGDVLFAGSIGRTDLPGGSFEVLERTIRTLLFPLGDDQRVLPGHGPETTIGRERVENPFVGERARLV